MRYANIKYSPPVMQIFTVEAKDIKSLKPDIRMIAKDLAEFLVSNGYVFCLDAKRCPDKDAFIYRFGVFAYKKKLDLP